MGQLGQRNDIELQHAHFAHQRLIDKITEDTEASVVDQDIGRPVWP